MVGRGVIRWVYHTRWTRLLEDMMNSESRTRRLNLRIEEVPTSTRTLYMSFMRLLGFSIAVATLALVAVLAATSSDAALVPTQAPDSTSVPQQLLNAHHCWSGAAPADMAGKIPSHAVVELNPQRGPQYVRSEVGFDIWQHRRTGTLFGFCR